MKTSSPWPRVLAEGAVIVVSILLAFGIDAWWDDAQRTREAHAMLETLSEEIRDARAEVDLDERT